jgi:PqqD family protein of HPr-rel-A system
VSLPADEIGSRFHVDEGALIWRVWDPDECVAYHRVAGETHLLNAVTAAVLRVLERSTLALDELCDTIADEFGVDDPAEYRASLALLLKHLDDLGMIRSVRRS